MSVLINGMDMPETCDDCPFHVYHSHHEYVCTATPLFYPMNLANSKGIRKDWCPLIPLPEKHGRLKDADALCEDITKTVDPIYSDMIEWAIGMVEAQPIVIEAEEI